MSSASQSLRSECLVGDLDDIRAHIRMLLCEAVAEVAVNGRSNAYVDFNVRVCNNDGAVDLNVTYEQCLIGGDDDPVEDVP